MGFILGGEHAEILEGFVGLLVVLFVMYMVMLFLDTNDRERYIREREEHENMLDQLKKSEAKQAKRTSRKRKLTPSPTAPQTIGNSVEDNLRDLFGVGFGEVEERVESANKEEDEDPVIFSQLDAEDAEEKAEDDLKSNEEDEEVKAVQEEKIEVDSAMECGVVAERLVVPSILKKKRKHRSRSTSGWRKESKDKAQ